MHIFGGNAGAKIWIDNEREENGIKHFTVHAKLSEKAVPEKFSVQFEIPHIECFSVWSPYLSHCRRIGPDWGPSTTYANIASSMPVQSVLSVDGNNRLTLAIDDAMSPTAIKTGVREEDGNIVVTFTFFTETTTAIEEYSATVRVDTRDIPFYDAVYDVVRWWENECGYTPLSVPEHAKLPMNSMWYSYHQNLDSESIVREARLAKELGMESIIVDDGWQTDNLGRGYAYCGDWELATTKIPDMREVVDRVHAEGVKLILWFSVPFVGKYSRAFERFKDMVLSDNPYQYEHTQLDPRYKEVRDFLIGIYKKYLVEWDLDGFKLDFIDSFRLTPSTIAPDDRRDYESLVEAIDRLMTDITIELKKIKPDILIEFRQTYVGPAIRKYGNMLRATDCPNDAISNRKHTLDLRLTSGNTAVHSDMLMWNKDDTPESAMLQFTSILYSVPQVSLRLDTISDVHRKALKFYLSFWRENADILMNGKLHVYDTAHDYSGACAVLDKKAIYTSYVQTVIDGADYDELTIVKASKGNSVYVKNCKGKSYTAVNCLGETISEGIIDSTIAEIELPLSGILYIK
ncbi:MAG: alpha-galactosidase [Clostridia bacterium]|nr:alpha-galactosidase [Clostridia bacterium]MBQ5716597.1 alpha-galactosidase [Clostridia bacterium]